MIPLFPGILLTEVLIEQAILWFLIYAARRQEYQWPFL
jgi:hypothetical protein